MTNYDLEDFKAAKRNYPEKSLREALDQQRADTLNFIRQFPERAGLFPERVVRTALGK